MKGRDIVVELRAIRDRVDSLIAAVTGEESGGSRSSSRPASDFKGIPLKSKYDGECAVCGEGYSEGDPVLFDPERPKYKTVAHRACGAVRPREGRSGRQQQRAGRPDAAATPPHDDGDDFGF